MFQTQEKTKRNLTYLIIIKILCIVQNINLTFCEMVYNINFFVKF